MDLNDKVDQLEKENLMLNIYKKKELDRVYIKQDFEILIVISEDKNEQILKSI